jgi:hypothetical protein
MCIACFKSSDFNRDMHNALPNATQVFRTGKTFGYDDVSMLIDSADKKPDIGDNIRAGNISLSYVFCLVVAVSPCIFRMHIHLSPITLRFFSRY